MPDRGWKKKKSVMKKIGRRSGTEVKESAGNKGGGGEKGKKKRECRKN